MLIYLNTLLTEDGITGYIKVNSVTGESTLQRTDKGLKYMRSAYFNDNLRRKLRFDYPTLIFGEKTFEIDDIIILTG